MFDTANPLDDLDLSSLDAVAADVAVAAQENEQRKFDDLTTDIRPRVRTLYRESTPPSALVNSSGECLYFDLETAPDWEREPLFGLPPLTTEAAETPADELMEPASFITSTLAECGKYLSSKIPPAEWLDAVVAVENARDKGPREGMLKLIKERRDAKDAVADARDSRIKLLSVTPLYCRIVAIGFQAGYSSGPPEAILCRNVDEEKAGLERLWAAIEKHSPVVGFNIRGFDVPVILARSIILGITPPKVLNRSRYNSRDILDLMTEIHGDRCPAGFGLKPTCRMLGIDPEAAEVDGSCVNDMVEAGQWDDIAAYVRSDVRLVQRLHRDRLAGVFCV